MINKTLIRWKKDWEVVTVILCHASYANDDRNPDIIQTVCKLHSSSSYRCEDVSGIDLP
jgi:hypothetical protein